MNYAWNQETDCYSEYWYTKTAGITNGFSSCNGTKTSYALKKCVTIYDATNNTEVTKNYYETKFNETENFQATDPFLDTDNKYELWRSKDRKSWIWLNPTTKEVVFL